MEKKFGGFFCNLHISISIYILRKRLALIIISTFLERFVCEVIKASFQIIRLICSHYMGVGLGVKVRNMKMDVNTRGTSVKIHFHISDLDT